MARSLLSALVSGSAFGAAPPAALPSSSIDISVIPYAAQLSMMATGEISKAGSPIPTMRADLIPPAAFVGAANVAGADYKSAFWLARASRIARFYGSRGGTSSEWFNKKASELLRAAMQYQAAGDMLYMSGFTPVSLLFPVSTSKESIQKVFDDASQLIATVGVPGQDWTSLVTQVRSLGTPEMTTIRQKQAEMDLGVLVVEDQTLASRIYSKVDKVYPLSWLGKKADDVKYAVVESVRPYTNEELENAKKGVVIYDDLAKKVRDLDEIDRVYPLDPQAKAALERDRNAVAYLANPISVLRDKLGMGPAPVPPPEPREAMGVFVVDDLAAALGVTTGVLVIVTTFTAAVIVISLVVGYLAHLQFETDKLLSGQYDRLSACVSDPSLPASQRKSCERTLSRLKGGEDWTSMAWAGVAAAVIGAGVYAFGPALRMASSEAAGTAKTELERWRQSRVPSAVGS